MLYFDNITTQEAGEKRYRELAMKFHPDKPGGNKEKFQEMKAEWDELKIFFKHQSRMGASAKKPTEARQKPNPPKSAKVPGQKPTPKKPTTAPAKKTRHTEKSVPRPSFTPHAAMPHAVKPPSSPLQELSNFVDTVHRAAPVVLSFLDGAERLFKLFDSPSES
jgi:hypothetical protein